MSAKAMREASKRIKGLEAELLEAQKIGGRVIYLAHGTDDERKKWTDLQAKLDKAEAEVERLKKWVNDLHSGMYINCVYCGHQYGPKDKVPSSMADVLKKHVEKCPKHPMSSLRKSFL